ncbi:hypothetical protein [Pelobium manganitolerans]|uniref:hypothetical protein n=1 Tax=Pelobium manganitolerans TaxID=1842495 RepID=UPI003FA35D67
MKPLFTKLLFVLILVVNASVFAQNTTSTVRHHWYVPRSAVLQHAGSIGYFSVGASYKLNKSGNSTLDFTYGYVPVKFGGDLNIITTKFTYRPYHFKIKDWGTLYPTNPGIFFSYHAGGDYDSTWDDDNYPKGYYWWSTAIRPHISLSTELKLNARKLLPNLHIKSLSLYSEFNTNELYAISYFQNPRDLNLTGIFKLGLGTRVEF